MRVDPPTFCLIGCRDLSHLPFGPHSVNCAFLLGIFSAARKPSHLATYFFQTHVSDFALQACAVGSKLGRSVTILPGLVVSLEAQSYVIASSSEIPKEFKLLSMMAYQTCGVFASVHANAFFETGATCNEFVLDSFHLGDEIISGFHSEL